MAPADWHNAALTRLTEIEASYELLQDLAWQDGHSRDAFSEDFAEFNSTCLAAIECFTSPQHSYTKQAMKQLRANTKLSSADLASALVGIVRSLRRDISDGMLYGLLEQERTETLENVISAGEQLLRLGRIDQAATVLGAVLDTHLLSLGAKYDIERAMVAVPGRVDVMFGNELNDDLAQVAYGPAKQVDIETALRVRHQAAYGDPGCLGHSTVAAMAQVLRVFVTDYPA